MSLLDTLIALENNNDFHAGRLLVLLGTFAGREGLGTIDGLTKLAKLDFLLRYPTYLERALTARGANAEDAKVDPYERQCVESKMVRYKYGPWDYRYRRFINLLVAKSLAKIEIEGKTIRIGLTSQGIQIAGHLRQQEEFKDLAWRSQLLKKHLNLGATNLKNFIYSTFPEIVTLQHGEAIKP